MNNTWEIEVSSPLLRPGITLRTKVSEKYLIPALKKAMEAVREFNQPEAPAPAEQGYTYVSEQHTTCGICAADKHTPIRHSEYGYICLSCIDKLLYGVEE